MKSKTAMTYMLSFSPAMEGYFALAVTWRRGALKAQPDSGAIGFVKGTRHWIHSHGCVNP